MMVGTSKSQEMAQFYENIFGRKADMVEGDWHGWKVGNTFFSIGAHSEIHGSAKEPQRIIMNFETKEIREEFDRIKNLGATVIKEPYDMGGGMMIATFADPDGNYFQLMTPWEG